MNPYLMVVDVILQDLVASDLNDMALLCVTWLDRRVVTFATWCGVALPTTFGIGFEADV